MEEGSIAVVRGKRVLSIHGAVLRKEAVAAPRVIIDLGAGDGRWIYRLARQHQDWLCVAVDANAAGMRVASRRAARKPGRGGAPNAWFIRAPVEALPSALSGLADEIHVHLPWGSLLRGVVEPRPAFLTGIAHLGKPETVLSISVNQSALDDILGPRLDGRGGGHDLLRDSLAGSYAAAGIDLEAVDLQRSTMVTSWGRRLGGGSLPQVWVLSGRVKRFSTSTTYKQDAAPSAGNRLMPPAVRGCDNLQPASE